MWINVWRSARVLYMVVAFDRHLFMSREKRAVGSLVPAPACHGSRLSTWRPRRSPYAYRLVLRHLVQHGQKLALPPALYTTPKTRASISCPPSPPNSHPALKSPILQTFQLGFDPSPSSSPLGLKPVGPLIAISCVSPSELDSKCSKMLTGLVEHPTVGNMGGIYNPAHPRWHWGRPGRTSDRLSSRASPRLLFHLTREGRTLPTMEARRMSFESRVIPDHLRVVSPCCMGRRRRK